MTNQTKKKEPHDYSGFHRFIDQEGNQYGSFEVFEGETDAGYGWYWWPIYSASDASLSSLSSSYPGPLSGPFASSSAAFTSASGINFDHI